RVAPRDGIELVPRRVALAFERAALALEALQTQALLEQLVVLRAQLLGRHEPVGAQGGVTRGGLLHARDARGLRVDRGSERRDLVVERGNAPRDGRGVAPLGGIEVAQLVLERRRE